MGPGGGGWKKCQIRSDAKFLEVGRIRKTGSGSGKRCDGQVGRVVQWPVSESRAATTCKSSPQRDTRRSQARERAEGQGRYGDTPTDPDSNTGPTKSEKRRDGCSTKNLSVWSVRACHHLSRSSRQFISKLFNPSSKNEAESPANTGTSDTTTTTPCRTKKQKTIKTHQSPPSSAEHAVVPPRPSAAAAHGVAHVDGNAAAYFFALSPKNQSCCSIRRFVRVAPRPKSCCCCCAPASINAIVVQSVGGRWSCWLWSVGRRVDSRRGSLGLAGCFGGGVVRQKSWLRCRGCGALCASACCGRILVAGRCRVVGGWQD